MLVDLGRNDLSRVCRARHRPRRALHGARALLARHPPRLRGRRRAARGRRAPFDLLRACFPAGTVSGAPKVRAMQLISELEGYRRGPYGGAVGYALPDGDLDTCIAIRTIVLHDGVAHLQAGAGIVADSDPHAEHEECLRKLAALETAITLAERNDDPARRQLRLVHVQPRPPVRGARRRGGRAPERRDRRGRGGAAGALPPRRLARPREAGGLRRDRRDRPPARADDARRSACASATRRSSRPSAARSARRSELVHGKASAVVARRPRDLRRPPAGLPGRPLPLARGDRGARGARGLGDDRGRRGDGRPPPRAAASTACSSTPSRCSRPIGPDLCRTFLEDDDPGRADGAARPARSLDRARRGRSMGEIMAGEATPAQIGGFLVALRLKGETPDEIAGFAEAIRGRGLAVRPAAGPTSSTPREPAATARRRSTSRPRRRSSRRRPVLAVAKHGNRAVSSASGSADVLEALGFSLDLPAGADRALDRRARLRLPVRPHAPSRVSGTLRPSAGSSRPEPSSTCSAR